MSDDEGNVHEPPSEMRDAVRKMVAQADAMVEYQELMAKLQRAKYDALRSQGFTDEQAIQLCKDVMP